MKTIDNGTQKEIIGRLGEFVIEWDSGVDKIKFRVLSLKAFCDPKKDSIWDENINWKLIREIEGERNVVRLQDSIEDYFLKKYSVEKLTFANIEVAELYWDESALNNLVGYGIGTRESLGRYLKRIGLPY